MPDPQVKLRIFAHTYDENETTPDAAEIVLSPAFLERLQRLKAGCEALDVHSLLAYPWQAATSRPRWLRCTNDGISVPGLSLAELNTVPEEQWAEEDVETVMLEVHHDEFCWNAVKKGTTIDVSTGWISLQYVRQVLREGGKKL